MMSRPRVRWLICVTRVVRVVFVYWARARVVSMSSYADAGRRDAHSYLYYVTLFSCVGIAYKRGWWCQWCNCVYRKPEEDDKETKMRKWRWLACDFCDAFTHYECEAKLAPSSALTGDTYACPKCRAGPKLPTFPRKETDKVKKANASATTTAAGRLLHKRPFLRVSAKPGSRVVGQVGPVEPLRPPKKRKLTILSEAALASASASTPATTSRAMKKAKIEPQLESMDDVPARVLAKQSSFATTPARAIARRKPPLQTSATTTSTLIKPRASKATGAIPVPAKPPSRGFSARAVIPSSTAMKPPRISLRPARPRAPKELAKATARRDDTVSRPPRASGSRRQRATSSGSRPRQPASAIAQPRRRSLVDSIGSLHAKFPVDIYETLYGSGSGKTVDDESSPGYRTRIEASMLQQRASKSPPSTMTMTTALRPAPIPQGDQGDTTSELKRLARAITQSLDPNFDQHTIYVNVCRLIHKLSQTRAYVTKEMIFEANLQNIIGGLLTSDDVRIRLAADSLLNIPSWREAICGTATPQRGTAATHATHLVGKPSGLHASASTAATTPAQQTPAAPILHDFHWNSATHLGVSSPEDATAEDAGDFLFHAVGEPHLRGDRRVR